MSTIICRELFVIFTYLFSGLSSGIHAPAPKRSHDRSPEPRTHNNLKIFKPSARETPSGSRRHEVTRGHSLLHPLGTKLTPPRCRRHEVTRGDTEVTRR